MSLTVKNLEAQDYNKDCMLSADGFGAALTIKEFLPLKKDDIRECFFLICDSKGELDYQRWLISVNSQFKDKFNVVRNIPD